MTQEGAPFTTKLHLVYLMNDVLHHCARKNAEELKMAFETVAVEMICGAEFTANADQGRTLFSAVARFIFVTSPGWQFN